MNSKRTARPTTVKRQAANIRMGIVPFVPNFALIGGWIYGSVKFAQGFHKTDYQRGYKYPLALLWPVFMLVNGNFRKNFMRTFRGD